jgi:hypothetical protein
VIDDTRLPGNACRLAIVIEPIVGQPYLAREGNAAANVGRTELCLPRGPHIVPSRRTPA